MGLRLNLYVQDNPLIYLYIWRYIHTYREREREIWREIERGGERGAEFKGDWCVGNLEDAGFRDFLSMSRANYKWNLSPASARQLFLIIACVQPD